MLSLLPTYLKHQILNLCERIQQKFHFLKSLYLEDQLCKFILILSAKSLRLILDSVPFKKYKQLLEHGRGSSLHLGFAPFIFKSQEAINEVRPS